MPESPDCPECRTLTSTESLQELLNAALARILDQDQEIRQLKEQTICALNAELTAATLEIAKLKDRVGIYEHWDGWIGGPNRVNNAVTIIRGLRNATEAAKTLIRDCGIQVDKIPPPWAQWENPYDPD